MPTPSSQNHKPECRSLNVKALRSLFRFLRQRGDIATISGCQFRSQMESGRIAEIFIASAG